MPPGPLRDEPPRGSGAVRRLLGPSRPAPSHPDARHVHGRPGSATAARSGGKGSAKQSVRFSGAQNPGGGRRRSGTGGSGSQSHPGARGRRARPPTPAPPRPRVLGPAPPGQLGASGSARTRQPRPCRAPGRRPGASEPVRRPRVGARSGGGTAMSSEPPRQRLRPAAPLPAGATWVGVPAGGPLSTRASGTEVRPPLTAPHARLPPPPRPGRPWPPIRTPTAAPSSRPGSPVARVRGVRPRPPPVPTGHPYLAARRLALCPALTPLGTRPGVPGARCVRGASARHLCECPPPAPGSAPHAAPSARTARARPRRPAPRTHRHSEARPPGERGLRGSGGRGAAPRGARRRGRGRRGPGPGEEGALSEAPRAPSARGKGLRAGARTGGASPCTGRPGPSPGMVRVNLPPHPPRRNGGLAAASQSTHLP